MEISDPFMLNGFGGDAGGQGGSSGSGASGFFAWSDALWSGRSGLPREDPFVIYPGGVDSAGRFHGSYSYSLPGFLEQALPAFLNPRPQSPAELYFELTGRKDYYDRTDLLKSPYLMAQNVPTNVALPATTYDFDGVRTFVKDGNVFDVYKNPDGSESTYRRGGYSNTDETVVAPILVDVTPPPNAPPTARSPFTSSPPEFPVPVTTSSAVPDWTTRTEWPFPKPDPRLLQPVTNADTGKRALNAVLNKVVLPWRNALAFFENIPLAALIGIDDALRRTFPVEYQPAQDLLPLQKTFGLALETGPAIEYSAAWLSTGWSKFSSNPRALNAAIFSIFGSLATDSGGGGLIPRSSVGAAAGEPVANLQHVITGGSGDRGIGVLHIDTSRLTPEELETTINHVKDADFQAGIANSRLPPLLPPLTRKAVPDRSVADKVTALARESEALSLDTGVAGHLPDVAGGGNPLGPISALPAYANSAIGGQWRRYAPGFTFDGFSLIDRATGKFLYVSLGLEHSPGPIFLP